MKRFPDLVAFIITLIYWAFFVIKHLDAPALPTTLENIFFVVYFIPTISATYLILAFSSPLIAFSAVVAEALLFFIVVRTILKSLARLKDQ
jgi:hypothetical protein